MTGRIGPHISVRRRIRRTINKQLRAQLKQISGWMHRHVDHDAHWKDLAVFQYRANQAGGYKTRDLTSHDQLAAAIAWMSMRVCEHCENNDEMVPSWLAPQ